MSWFSNSFTNLKEQLNSLISEDEYNSQTIEVSKISEESDETSDKNAENFSYHEKLVDIRNGSQQTQPKSPSMHLYRRQLESCLADVNSLHGNLNDFFDQVTNNLNILDYLHDEISQLKKDNCQLLNSQQHENNNCTPTPIVSNKETNCLGSSSAQDTTLMTKKADSNSFPCTELVVDTESKVKNVTECVFDESQNDFMKEIEKFILAAEHARKEQLNLLPKLRKVFSNLCSVDVSETLFNDYVNRVEENYAIWEKLKVMLILPAVARLKNAQISELSVPDSVKEVFQPNFLTMSTIPVSVEQTPEPVTDTSTKVAESDESFQQKNEIENSHMSAELMRLRKHLISVEQAYTNELLQCEEEIKILRTQLQNSEQKINSMTESYTSINLRTNQIIDSLKSEVKQHSEEKEILIADLKNCQTELHRSMNETQNLRSALDLFHKTKDSEIVQATEKLQSNLEAIQRENGILRETINALRRNLDDSKLMLKEYYELKEERSKKNDEIKILQDEIYKLKIQLNNAEEKISQSAMDGEAKIKINLIKNIVFRYLTNKSADTKTQSLRILANVLDFSDQEKIVAGLCDSSSEKFNNDQSLIGEFIRFVEKESYPKAVDKVEKMVTDEKFVPDSSLVGITATTSLHQTNSGTSSSILKDALHSVEI